MPPLTGQGGLPSAKIVLGDRFGRSASGRLTDAAAHIFAARGLKVAQNHPYPGNYLLERHGRPSFNVHAIQCEIDRSLYLDGAFSWPSAGQIGRASCREKCVSTFSSRWSPYHEKQNNDHT